MATKPSDSWANLVNRNRKPAADQVSDPANRKFRPNPNPLTQNIQTTRTAAPVDTSSQNRMWPKPSPSSQSPASTPSNPPRNIHMSAKANQTKEGGERGVAGGHYRAGYIPGSASSSILDSKPTLPNGSWRTTTRWPGSESSRALKGPGLAKSTEPAPIPQSQRSWGRLKPVSTDPLEEYGLPSKGETRLNDKKAQEGFYNVIVERYMKFCAAHSETSDSLTEQFESLSLAGSSQRRSLVSSNGPILSSESSEAPSKMRASSAQLYITAPSAAAPSKELESILMAMRKLRESLTSSRRKDEFAQRVHVLIIRAALLCSIAEAYHPSLKSLLESVHLVTPLPPSEFVEFTGYLILDKACRQGDLQGAHRVRINTVGYSDHRVDQVLQALTRKDWASFWSLWRLVDGYQRGVMAWAVEGLRLHALKCMAKTYFSVERSFLEQVTGENWDRLQEFGLGWELEKVDSGSGVITEKIVMRRPKQRSAAAR